jgi:acyl-CoA reductase-like NAD-dependent aldehyde dehydrogenase
MKARRAPGDESMELPQIAETPVEPVLAAASQAARKWAQTPLAERIAMLRSARTRIEQAKDGLAAGIAMETGKPITEARGEMGAVLAKFELAIEDAEEFLAPVAVSGGPHPALIRQWARGPAVVIAPFNFPIHLGHGALVAYLLAGNPVIFKPSPQAAGVAGEYARLMETAFPPGVFNLVQGGAEEAIAISVDPRVRAVCFTGSVSAGRSLAQALAGDFSKDLALELGGRNAAIVCADADPAVAARAIADGACLTCGQRCNATSRVLVEKNVAPKLVDLLVENLGRFFPGDPLRDETTLGPLIDSRAVERYIGCLEEKSDWIVPGAAVGEADGKRGHYVQPALRRGLTSPNVELFVPVIELEVVDNLDQAVSLHNASPFGLSASIFTRSEAQFYRIADALDAANIYSNLPTTFSPSTLPFGGWGLSGNGRPGGRKFIRFTTREQALQFGGGF